MDPLTIVILDTRRIKANKKYPLKLRLTYNRKQKYYPIGLDLTKKEYALARGERPRGEPKKWQLKMTEAEAKTQRIIGRLVPFSFYEFEKQFYDERPPKMKVDEAFEDYIKIMNEEGKYKTGISYDTARRSFKKFYADANFVDVNIQFLKDYEKWMVERGRSLTTVGIYVRAMRTIYNQAIRQELIPLRYYPFGRRKYEIPIGRNVKKSLTLEELQRIHLYKPAPGTWAERSKDFWMFSYLCNGMNFNDIAHLRYSNLADDMLIFYRGKTKRTTRGNQKPIIVPMLPESKAIMKKYGNRPVSVDTYIFPILKPGMDPFKEIDTVNTFIQVTNNSMKNIAGELGITKPVTTYVARHTFATVLKRSGVSTEFISEQLGHTSLLTTENYLDSFETQVKRDISLRLLDFSGLPPNKKEE